MTVCQRRHRPSPATVGPPATSCLSDCGAFIERGGSSGTATPRSASSSASSSLRTRTSRLAHAPLAHRRSRRGPAPGASRSSTPLRESLWAARGARDRQRTQRRRQGSRDGCRRERLINGWRPASSKSSWDIGNDIPTSSTTTHPGIRPPQARHGPAVELMLTRGDIAAN